MSTFNLDSFYKIFKYEAIDEQKDHIDKIILDYSFMYFLKGICVLITNYLFIQIVSLLSQYKNFKAITQSDHLELIPGVPKQEKNGLMKDKILKMFLTIQHH